MTKVAMTQELKDILKSIGDEFAVRASRKRSAYVKQFQPFDANSYWSGGSRDYYAFVDLSTGKVLTTGSNHPVFEADQPRRVESLPENVIAVRYGIFCGKTATPVFIAPEGVLNQLLTD